MLLAIKGFSRIKKLGAFENYEFKLWLLQKRIHAIQLDYFF